MTSTPEHMVRVEWASDRIVGRCIVDGCGWSVAVTYPDDVRPRRAAVTERQMYRAAVQAASVHGWPDLDWQPADGILAARDGCTCQPDPTADARFWARIRAMAGAIR